MWPNPKFPADLVIFTEEILNGKLHILCSVRRWLLLLIISLSYVNCLLDIKCFLLVMKLINPSCPRDFRKYKSPRGCVIRCECGSHVALKICYDSVRFDLFVSFYKFWIYSTKSRFWLKIKKKQNKKTLNLNLISQFNTPTDEA